MAGGSLRWVRKVAVVVSHAGWLPVVALGEAIVGGRGGYWRGGVGARLGSGLRVGFRGSP